MIPATSGPKPVGCLDWSDEEIKRGKVLKVKGIPKDCKLKLFRVRVSTRRTDHLVTNEAEPHETAVAEYESSVRWTVEQFYRELKQLTGVPARTCFKQAAYQTHKTVCQLKQGFLDDYMRHELEQPVLAFA